MSNTPDIRFKGFTEPWELRKLFEVSTAFEYGLNAAAKEYDGENKYIRITDISDDTHEFMQLDLTSPDVDLSDADNYRLSEGDILFARTGASVGKTYIYKTSDGLVYYAGFLIRAKIKPEYSPEFVFQNTLTRAYNKFISVTSMRSGQPGVNAQEYSQYEIMVPSKPEQDKISTYLGRLDQLITLHQCKCDEMSELKKFMLKKMFPKNGEQFPEIRFSGFTASWEQRKLSEMTTYRNGVAHEDKQSKEGKYELINLNSVSVDGVLKPSGRFIDEADETLCKDDLVMVLSDVGHGDLLGRVAIIPENNRFVLNQRVALLRSNETVSPHFLLVCINAHQRYFKLNGAGSSQLNISKGLVENFSPYVPAIPEQELIANYFNKLDNLIILHQRKRDEFKDFKNYMLQNMFPKKG